MTVGGINGLLAYNSLEEVRAVSRRRGGSIVSAGRPGATDESSSRVASSQAATTSAASGSGEAGASNATELTDAEKKEVARLQARDREVRSHEQAHKAVAGSHARGGPKYSTTRGPDGRSYAIEGSVSIDTSAIPGEPEKTLAKMQQVRRAALAPSEPSSQDARVAADAAQKANEARLEIAKESREGSGIENASNSGDERPRTEVAQIAAPSSDPTQSDPFGATRGGDTPAAASLSASSLEARYARAGGNERERVHTGYRLDVRV